MKTIIFSFGAALLLLASCNNKSDRARTMDERAQDNARTYLFTELGIDSTRYNGGKWGTVERRKVDWRNSNRYKLYSDTLTMMQDHLRMMNDSLDAELRMNGVTPAYKSMQLRRDGYQMYYNTYSNEFDQIKTYDGQPEYHGYWIYHEYDIDGEPQKVYIGLDDTTTLNGTDIIYE